MCLPGEHDSIEVLYHDDTLVATECLNCGFRQGNVIGRASKEAVEWMRTSMFKEMLA